MREGVPEHRITLRGIPGQLLSRGPASSVRLRFSGSWGDGPASALLLVPSCCLQGFLGGVSGIWAISWQCGLGDAFTFRICNQRVSVWSPTLSGEVRMVPAHGCCAALGCWKRERRAIALTGAGRVVSALAEQVEQTL